MNRISSYNQFFGNSSGIATGQANMAKAQAQASSQKVATDLKGYAQDSGRLLSAKSYSERLDRRAETLSALSGRAEVEATALARAEEVIKQFRDSLGTAIATQNGVGLRDAMDNAVATLGSVANTQYAGQAVFGGSWGYGEPFVTATLDEMALAGGGGAGAFWVDTGENRTVMVEDNRAIQLSGSAKEIFKPMIDFLRQMREWENTNTPITGKLTAAQSTFLQAQLPGVAALHTGLIDQEAAAGITAKEIEQITLANQAQRDTLNQTIGAQENVDLAEVATRLAAAQTQYQASASIFSQMRDMNLLQYLR
jgi:flagellar hook-associated protein 3 FlgL